MEIHVVTARGWVLETISDELMRIKAEGLRVTRSAKTRFAADINYYVNWKHWKSLDPLLTKSRFDLAWFTHLEAADTVEILDAADLVVSQSNHGKAALLARGIREDKIEVAPGVGPQPHVRFKKTRLGVSGRPYEQTNRKRQDLLVKLSADLDSRIFQFVFSSADWRAVAKAMQRNSADCVIEKSRFWETIDYWLSASEAEGGPMDAVNAFQAGIPVISRPIGYFRELKTEEDFFYRDDGDLVRRLKQIESVKHDKLAKATDNTWENFRNWHTRLFEAIRVRAFRPQGI